MLFFAASSIGTEYGSDDADVYSRLANTYENNTNLGAEENGTLRKISDKLEAGKFSTVSAAVGAIDGALQAVKFMKESVDTTGRIADQVQEDSQGRIHPIIPKIIKSITSVVIIIIILVMFMKIKPET